MRVIEIGCGAGRMTRALARFFGEVHAVDISPEMVRLARHAVAGFENAHVYATTERTCGCCGGRFGRDFFACRAQIRFCLFEHGVPAYSEPVDHRIVRWRRGGAGSPGALFKFQVQGNPRVAAEGKNSWVGASFTETDAREMAERCGFELRYQAGAGDQYYWLWFFRRG